MVPSCSPVICPSKTPKPHRPLIAPSLRKLWFSEGPVFWQKYSNSPGVAKSWHMSKVTIRCHKRCAKLSWVQIWQKNSNGKCPKLPITDSHSVLLGGLSVNLNHLKSLVTLVCQPKKLHIHCKSLFLRETAFLLILIIWLSYHLTPSGHFGTSIFETSSRA